MNVTLNPDKENKVLRAAVSGNIDTTTSDQFEQELLPAITGCDAVEIDMTEVDYISSAGLRILLKLVQLCPATTIKNPNSVVKDVLEMTGMNSILTIA